MKCRTRTSVALVVGIAAGFILSALLQNILLASNDQLSSRLIVTRFAQDQNNPDKSKNVPFREGADFITHQQMPSAATDSASPPPPAQVQQNTASTSAPTSETTPSQEKEDSHQAENHSLKSDPIKLQQATSTRSTLRRRQQKPQPTKNLPIHKLSDELSLRRPIIIAVITSVHNLMSQVLAIHSTWGRHHSKSIVYFVGEHAKPMPHIPHSIEVIQLQGIDDGQDNWNTKEMATITYLTDHFLEDVDWFLVVNDQIFVNIEALKSKLENHWASSPVYMGQSVTESKTCNQLTGVVYSQGLLSHLEAYLTHCRSNGQSIGQCIVERGFRCTQAEETNKMFYLGSKEVIETNALFTTKDISQAVTIHPVSYPQYMYRLYSYFLEITYNTSSSRAKMAANDILITRPFVPTNLRSPYKVEEIQDSQKTATQEKVESSQQQATSAPNVLVRPPHVPKNKFEVNTWEYFNQTRIMSVFNEQPSRGIIGGLREEARYVLTKAIYQVNQGVSPKDRIMFEKLENGYHRIDPMRGSEYILDFVFRKNSDRSTRIKKRVSLLRPFHETVVPVASSQMANRVNFIVTLSGLSNRLEQFLTNFERNFLTQNEDSSLTIVLFEGPDKSEVHKLVNKYAKRYPGTSISILDTQGNFARGKGLDHGARHFQDNELLFFVDVDLKVSTNFLRRCQLNTVRGRQVYFPIFYKLYNLDFVNRYFKGNNSHLLSRHNGHWAHYSYGMVCIYASDYRKSTGFNTNMHGWGEEDIDFLNRVMSHSLEVFRSPDPGLVHLWHRKVCDKDAVASPRAYLHCLQSKAENLADRTELAQYVFENELSRGNVL